MEPVFGLRPCGSPIKMTQGRAVGPEVEVFEAKRPNRDAIVGKLVTLEPLSTKHVKDLFPVVGGDDNAALWDYMGDGPYADEASLLQALEKKERSEEPFFYAIICNDTRKALGYLSYLNIEPTFRSVEVGHVLLSSQLQRTRAATEVQYLLAKHAIENLGYRRYQWKCNALNQPSRNAALRLGFTFEGIHRQEMIVKGRNRDTAYFSILDSEWPIVKKALEAWLDSSNFDENGNQKLSLKQLRG